MIAIDTNILLRYLLNDDPKQSKLAINLINGSDRVLITDVVIAEAIWTLKGKKYQLDKEGVINVISMLFAEPNICFEDGQTVWKALNDYKSAKSVKISGKSKTADFPDALIVNKAHHASKLLGESCEGLYTFDVAALKLPGTKKP